MELTKEQISKASYFFKIHQSHVMALVLMETENKQEYAPSEEDASSPELWKGPHWNWFLKTYHYN